MISFGVLAAIGALVGWGVADFLLQRISRKNESVHMLFCSGLVGLFITLPLAWTHLGTLSSLMSHQWWLIAGICLGIFVNVFFSIEALRSGKLAVISPVFALELPLTVILTVLIAHEFPSMIEFMVILLIFAGFFLLTFRGFPHDGKKYMVKLEKGVLMALVGVIGLAFYNLTVGLVSRLLYPTVTSFIINLFMLAFSSIVLIWRKEFTFPGVFEPLRRQPLQVIATSVLYTGAALCFAYATTQMPISVATGISEGYVALAVLLGLSFGHERLKRNQYIGVGIVILGIITLALLAS